MPQQHGGDYCGQHFRDGERHPHAGRQQAREFNRELELDALIVTKLDGTAKGGIALAVSHELELPIIKIGVGEGLDDLRDFDPHDFARALVGAFDQRQA